MSFRRTEVEFKDSTYFAFIGEKVESFKEVSILKGGGGGNYFFGQVFETDDGKRTSFFGSGPDHVIFEKAVREAFDLPKDAWARHSQVCTASNSDNVVASVLFTRDPGELKDGYYVEDTPEVSRRRRGVIKSLIQGISEVCDNKVGVGWLVGGPENLIRYYYLPKQKLLLKVKY